jgi:ribosome-binding factor A
VASLIQNLLGPIITEVVLETNALVTVSKVEVTRDMRHAKAWLSILGGNDEQVLALLQKHAYEIQGDINRQMSMKIVPRIQFSLDTSPRFAQHISDIITHIREDEAGTTR